MHIKDLACYCVNGSYHNDNYDNYFVALFQIDSFDKCLLNAYNVRNGNTKLFGLGEK